jgi:hypothetical protein
VDSFGQSRAGNHLFLGVDSLRRAHLQSHDAAGNMRHRFNCSHKCSHGANKEKRVAAKLLQPVDFIGGVDGTRTRDPRRDRPVF